MNWIILIFYMSFIIALSYPVHILLHEVGHLLGGWVTGWKFISLQLGKILIRRDSKIKIVKTSNRAFRCVMYPRNISQGAVIYTISGFVINALASLVAFWMMIRFSTHIYLWLLGWSALVMGLTFVILNSLPRVNHIISDGECFRILYNSPITKLCHNAQFMVARELTMGKSYERIDSSLFCILQEDAVDDVQAYHRVLEFYYHLDKKEMNLALSALNSISNNGRISKEVLTIIEAEKIYIKLNVYISRLTRMNELVKEPVQEEPIQEEYKQQERIVEYLGISTWLTRKEEEFLDSLWIQFQRLDIHIQRILITYDILRLLMSTDLITALERLQYHINEITEKDVTYKGEKEFCICQLCQLKHIIMYKILQNIQSKAR